MNCTENWLQSLKRKKRNSPTDLGWINAICSLSSKVSIRWSICSRGAIFLTRRALWRCWAHDSHQKPSAHVTTTFPSRHVPTRSPSSKCEHRRCYAPHFNPNLRSGVIFFLLLCFFGSRGKNITWYIYLTSHQPSPNLHNLTPAWPVMLLANQCLPEGNQILAGIMSLSK